MSQHTLVNVRRVRLATDFLPLLLCLAVGGGSCRLLRRSLGFSRFGRGL
jgi:hypothetical protein